MCKTIVVRKIIHIDMDAFYASVEQRDRAELRGKPVVVGGSPQSRGVVASASYEARRFGIRSAMPCRKAQLLCPDAHFIPPDFSKYKQVHQSLMDIFRQVTELVEPLALDEAYLDVTTNLFKEPSATKLAAWIREQIASTLNLTASAGVAPNKFLAKYASEFRKPNGLFVIRPQDIEQVVEKIPVEKLWGVGPATRQKLNQAGIFTTADIRSAGLSTLQHFMGSSAEFFYELSFGRDKRLVKSHRPAKSKGAETTFSKNLTTLAEMETVIEKLVRRVHEMLFRKELKARTFTLKVRTETFDTFTRSYTLPKNTSDLDDLRKVASTLLTSFAQGKKLSIRLLGFSAKQFELPTVEEDRQQTLF